MKREEWEKKYKGQLRKITVTVKDIRGICGAGLKPGDKFVIEGSNLILKESDKVCPTALVSIYPMIFAMKFGVDPKFLGGEYAQCLDPGPPYTCGGTVIFEIKAEKKGSSNSVWQR